MLNPNRYEPRQLPGWGDDWLLWDKACDDAYRNEEGIALTFSSRHAASMMFDHLWGGGWRADDPKDIFKYLNDFKVPDTVYVIGAGATMSNAWRLIPKDAFCIGVNRTIQHKRKWDIWMIADIRAPEYDWYHTPTPAGCKKACVIELDGPDADYTFQVAPAIAPPAPLWAGRLQGGGTISASAIRLAYELGARDLILAGVDLVGARHFDGSKAADNDSEWPQLAKCQWVIDWLVGCGMRIRSLTDTALKVDRI